MGRADILEMNAGAKARSFRDAVITGHDELDRILCRRTLANFRSSVASCRLPHAMLLSSWRHRTAHAVPACLEAAADQMRTQQEEYRPIAMGVATLDASATDCE